MEELLWGAPWESESPGGSYSWGGIATEKMYWRMEGAEYTLAFRLLPVSQWWNPIWGQQAREPVCKDQPLGAQNVQRKMGNVFGGGKWTLPECLHQLKYFIILWSVGSVAQLCPTLCDSMDCNTPGFLVHYQLLELAQTHVHRVGDAIQTSRPVLSPSPPAFNLSQHQGLFLMGQFFASGG